MARISYLSKAFYAYPFHLGVPLEENIYISLINNVPFEDKNYLLDHLKKYPILSNNKHSVVEKLTPEVRQIVQSTKIADDIDHKYHDKHIEISAILDSLTALEQTSAKNKSFDKFNLIPSAYRNIDMSELSISDILCDNLLIIYKQYGLIGKQSCKNCYNI